MSIFWWILWVIGRIVRIAVAHFDDGLKRQQIMNFLGGVWEGSINLKELNSRVGSMKDNFLFRSVLGGPPQ